MTEPQLGVFVSSLSNNGVASLEPGTETTWHITAPFREFWVLSGPSMEPEGA